MNKIFRKSICVVVLTIAMVTCLGAVTAKAREILEFAPTFDTATTANLNTVYTAHTSKTGWIKFETSKDSGYYTIRTIMSVSNFWASATIYDAQMNEISDISGFVDSKAGNTSTKTLALNPASTYYIGISDNGNEDSATFNFTVNFRKDAVGNDMNQATKLKLKKAKSSTIDSAEDIDWFKFKTNSKGTYRLVASVKQVQGTNKDITVEVYDKNMNLMTCKTKGFWGTMTDKDALFYIQQGEPRIADFSLKKNTTYYIKVSNNGDSTGNKYALKVYKK